MGRSVMTLAGATATAYNYLEPNEEFYQELWNEDETLADNYEDVEEFMWELWNDGDSQYDYEALRDGVQERLIEMFPSFESVKDEWVGNELLILVRNAHSIVTLSTYGDSVAICLGANYDRNDYFADPSDISGLGEAWRKKISDRFLSEFSRLTKVGTASNGESFYQKVS